MQLRTGGGSAGHKGVESVVQHLGTRDFHRLRMGIGKPQEVDVYDYVLSTFGPGESVIAREVIEAAAHGLELFFTRDFEQARQWINSQKIEPGQ